MDELKRKLILKEIESRLQAAGRLSEASDESDSGYLLRLLALELALKLVYELCMNKKAPHHHAYEKIFNALPIAVRDNFLGLAGERIGPSALTRDAPSVLKELGKNFSGLRYPYERYEGMTERQYLEAGGAWVQSGCPSEKATFRFYPEELTGLLFAAQALARTLP